jgi:hypothetical protein
MNPCAELKLTSGTNGLKDLIEEDPHSAGSSYQKMTNIFKKFMKSPVQIGISQCEK